MKRPSDTDADNLVDCLDRTARLERILSSSNSTVQKLTRRLYFDGKTGLPNHAFLERDIEKAISSSDDQFALIFIALDDTFDLLKKSQKSVLSEWVLYKTAVSIKALIRPNGRVYQTKSHEFAILLNGVDRARALAKITELSGDIVQMHRFPGQTVTIGCHIGCSIYPDHGASPGDLLRNADIAQSAATASSRAGLIYDTSMSDEISERVAIQEGILHALEEQADEEIGAQFSLVYQPLVRIIEQNGRGLKTRTVGTECLLRWNHPDRGAISPDRFIPLAEESGLIIPIGNWVFYRAAEQFRLWKDRGIQGIYLAINLSPVQFRDHDLVANIQRLLDRHRLSPASIHLEITETAVMDDPAEAMDKINILHDLGIRLSIDDFGTGYSSLGYLRDLRVDTLKIDKSFIDSVVEDTYNQGIVRAVVTMARGLGMEVLAEGIETREQAEFLHSVGCSNLQGYLFSKPVSAVDFQDFVSQEAAGAVAATGDSFEVAEGA